MLVARIFALGRKRQEEIRPDLFIVRTVRDRALHPGLFQHRQHQFLGRSRIGRRFQHHQLAPLQVRANGLRRVLHVGKVRLAPLIERRGHADDDRVDFRQPRKIGGRAEMLGLHELLNFVLRNVLDVGLAAVQLFDFGRVGVKPGYAMPGFGKPQSQRQSHVSTPNNSDAELRALEVFRLAIGRHRCLFLLLSNFHDGHPRADYNNFLIAAIPARRAPVPSC